MLLGITFELLRVQPTADGNGELLKKVFKFLEVYSTLDCFMSPLLFHELENSEELGSHLRRRAFK